MKLRCKGNSLRLRLNQTEVRKLAQGVALQERVDFPDGSRFSYVLERNRSDASASFSEGTIRIAAPASLIDGWSVTDEIGMYFEVPAAHATLRVAIEKDLECVDGPAEERDPDAFPRMSEARC